jgi:hypothetical protein
MPPPPPLAFAESEATGQGRDTRQQSSPPSSVSTKEPHSRTATYESARHSLRPRHWSSRPSPERGRRPSRRRSRRAPRRRERSPPGVGQMPEHLVDDRFACMEVDRGARRGERVGTFRMQCSVDGGEPTTLAVTNQVDAAAAMCDGAVDDLEVVDNRRIGGVVRGTNPSSDNPAAPQSPGQMLSDLQDPALRRAATMDLPGFDGESFVVE